MKKRLFLIQSSLQVFSSYALKGICHISLRLFFCSKLKKGLGHHPLNRTIKWSCVIHALKVITHKNKNKKKVFCSIHQRQPTALSKS